MLPETLPIEQTYPHRVTPLRWLESACAGRGLTTVLVPDMARAYLRVISPRGPQVTVWLDTADGGRCFRWGEPPAFHSLADVAGCAARVAGSLT